LLILSNYIDLANNLAKVAEYGFEDRDSNLSRQASLMEEAGVCGGLCRIENAVIELFGCILSGKIANDIHLVERLLRFEERRKAEGNAHNRL
jgi:hypothetical protein